jgi:DNA modification methylase
VTSPPYNVGAAYATYDDNLPEAEYLALLADAFAACAGVMVDGARIAVVTPAGVGRSPWRPFSPRIAVLLDRAGFTLRGQIIWSRLGHPAPFPVALVERLIRFYGFPGCHVLDPFAGSGTTGVAAARLGCRATLVEVDAGYCELAAKRIALGAKPGRSPQPHLRAPTRPVCDPAEVSPCAA